MKITITGARAEGKSRLLEVIRRRVLDDYGATVYFNDGGQEDYTQGGYPTIEILVTNDMQEAIDFIKGPTK